MRFNTYADSCNHHHPVGYRTAPSSPKICLMLPLGGHILPTNWAPGNHWYVLHLSTSALYLDCHINDISCVTFWERFLSLSIMPLRIIHVVSYWCCCWRVIHFIDEPQFNYSSTERHLDGFQFLAIMWRSAFWQLCGENCTFVYRFLCEYKFHFSWLNT